MHKIIIAIDGFSSCGKSSTAKGVAAHMEYAYIDTGAMYRAVTLYFLENHISFTDQKDIQEALDNIHIEFRRNAAGQNVTYLNGLNVESKIRDLKIADKVSEVSTISAVRKNLVEQQRKMGKKKGIVMDGRDIGSVVFPDAELKVFMTAETNIRAHRRQIELAEKGNLVDLEDIIANLEKRDHIDANRADSPLVKVEDAIEIDTSHITLEEQIMVICKLAKKVIADISNTPNV